MSTSGEGTATFTVKPEWAPLLVEEFKIYSTSDVSEWGKGFETREEMVAQQRKFEAALAWLDAIGWGEISNEVEIELPVDAMADWGEFYIEDAASDVELASDVDMVIRKLSLGRDLKMLAWSESHKRRWEGEVELSDLERDVMLDAVREYIGEIGNTLDITSGRSTKEFAETVEEHREELSSLMEALRRLSEDIGDRRDRLIEGRLLISAARRLRDCFAEAVVENEAALRADGTSPYSAETIIAQRAQLAVLNGLIERIEQ